MHNSIFKKPTSIFPISVERGLNVYVRGIQLKRISEAGDVTEYKFYKELKNENPAVNILDKFKDTALDYPELHLVLDIIKDLVNKKELIKEYLTDYDLQAKFISRQCKCVCSTAQMKGVARYKHPIKERLKRLKKVDRWEI